MRTIQGAIFSDSQGLNPQIRNPGDPWERTMNYPEIWLQIARALKFETESNFMVWNLLVISVFLMACAYILLKSPDLKSLIAICSTSTLLAIERGNNDLLIFSLLAGSIIVGGFSGKIYLLLGIVLKIYPIFTIPFLAMRKKEKFILCLASLAYLVVINNQLRFISSGNSAGGPLSYGLKTTAVVTRDYILSFFGARISVIVVLIGLGMFIIVCLIGVVKFSNQKVVDCQQKVEHLFLLGSSIYCTTFILSANWDYRLIFLILCLPWIRAQKWKRKLLLLGTIIVSSNYLLLNMVLPHILVVILTTLAKLLLFTVLAVELHVLFRKKHEPIRLQSMKAE
jgi:hypothetical protein